MRASSSLLASVALVVWPVGVLARWAATGPRACEAGGDCYWLAPTRTLPGVLALAVLPPAAWVLARRRARRRRGSGPDIGVRAS